MHMLGPDRDRARQDNNADRKSTRLNSSHLVISYAVFSLKKNKKVRDVSVALAQRAYGLSPDKLYFIGSSECGREEVTMAQPYPSDFDVIFSRVPVLP